mmetsp:Transcript_78939/g.118647  ORF Transcript_78939/g.118647 Transcript_78939/m.118647 type:complete len:251 (-) Transcript_78939:36-788(-)|eukprot:CAMPEP_0117009718 /NCGR_PEP_ID=MMETSP0472-20121206/8747_1 /TAXON_ID=693140 ORGANISM="Tiarina fusus, Strain LIS" /NCGR_SAMPLE_ID=MMETSP0472 /ASSEMBLY_ACC=CAM_ASM_000603 /LENGTH=250 /DNA_ID=CAMNT_0004712065 /DNA_START=14 /DNA_END=766 /DNA_ORIENTATION=-
MKLIEYRIPMPMTCEEYRIGQLYAVAKSSNQETSGDSGVEVLKNEPYEKDGEKGQYTEKIYHLGNKVPGWVAAVAPASALKIEEKAWNAFPHCKTELTNPFMGARFTYTVDTLHYDDNGEQENVHNLDKAQLKLRTINRIDITKPVPDSLDPTTFKSEKTGRGNLQSGFEKDANPIMCAYKLITVDFRYFGLQTKMENFILSFQDNLIAKFHQQLFCWIDEWYGMSVEDIRAYEIKLAEEMAGKLDTPKE